MYVFYQGGYILFYYIVHNQNWIKYIKVGIDMSLRQQYSSQNIAKASELELQNLLKKFKSECISVGNFGLFVAYNLCALTGLVGFTSWYIKSKWIKKGDLRRSNPKELTLSKIVKKGSLVGAFIGGLYITGFLIVGYYTMPIQVFKKYCQLQETLHSFEIKYDPFYQQMLLYRKMKKFGLSDSLISEIKTQLNEKKLTLIKQGKLKTETMEALKKAEQLYEKSWKNQLR